MKNKKTIYIALAVLFALLAATLIIHAAVPAFPMHAVTTETVTPDGTQEHPGFAQPAASNPLVWISRLWLPISAVCAAGAVLLLILLRRNLIANAPEKPSENTMPALDMEDDEPPHRANNQGFWVAGLCAVLAVALLIASMPTATPESVSVNTRVISGKAAENSISTVLSGGGTLTAADSETVSVPVSIEVEAYHVKNGDLVSKGDPLATISMNDVRVEIAKLQELMDDLDYALVNAKNDDLRTHINATTAGRVKKIYAEAGKSVAETVYENGALMILSLDGYMLVQVPGNLPINSEVTVTLSDGKTEKGKVNTVSDGIATVSISDERAPVDDLVTVSDADGNLLGSGILTISSPLKVVSYYGTVSNVSVRLNQKITVDTNLLTVRDAGHTIDYFTLLARRAELEERMEKLIRYSVDGMVTAETDGIVSGVDKDIDYIPLEPMQIRSNSAPELIFAPLYCSDRQPTIMFLSSVAPVNETGETPDSSTSPNVEDTGSGETPPPEEEEEEKGIPGVVVGATDTTITVQTPIGETTITKGEIPVYADWNNIPVGSTVVIYSDHVVVTPPASSTPTFPGGMDLGSILAGLGGFSFGGFGGFGSSAASVPEYESYDLAEQDILTITSTDQMTVTVPVDELDILSIHEGMEASITLDAIKGQSFSGEITHINYYGSNQGGNSKYDVEVTLDRTPQMLEGMNASIKVVTAVSKPVSTIPVAALQEESGKTCIYTSYDEKTDTLGGLTEVETGISDGEVVEILSGMDEDTAYFYRYADSIDYTFVQ